VSALTPCHLGKRQAASPPRTPQPLRLPHPAVSRRVPPGRPAESAGHPRPDRPAQSQSPSAVTNQFRPLRVTPLTASSSRVSVAARGDRGLATLSLFGFAERQHAARAPRLIRAKTATSTWIGRAGMDRPHTDRDLTGTLPNTSAPEDSTQSRQTALKALRIAVSPRRCRAVAKSGHSRPG
jgi:hypothetical protein